MGGLSSNGDVDRVRGRVSRLYPIVILALLFVGAFVPWLRRYYADNPIVVIALVVASVLSLYRSRAKSKPSDGADRT